MVVVLCQKAVMILLNNLSFLLAKRITSGHCKSVKLIII